MYRGFESLPLRHLKAASRKPRKIRPFRTPGTSGVAPGCRFCATSKRPSSRSTISSESFTTKSGRLRIEENQKVGTGGEGSRQEGRQFPQTRGEASRPLSVSRRCRRDLQFYSGGHSGQKSPIESSPSTLAARASSGGSAGGACCRAMVKVIASRYTEVGEPFSMGCLLFSDAHMLSCRPENAKAGRDDNEKKV